MSKVINEELMSLVITRLIFEEENLAVEALDEMLAEESLESEPKEYLERLREEILEGNRDNEELVNLAERVNIRFYGLG